METLGDNSTHALGLSTETALCLIPPRHLWHRVDCLRSLHDKAYGAWPPCVNLIYPFVRPERLTDAAHIISRLDLASLVGDSLSICLDEPSVFDHKQQIALCIIPSNDQCGAALKRLRKYAIDALGMEYGGIYQPHMTIAQSDDMTFDSHQLLAEKVRLFAPLEWDINQLAVLVRDCEQPGMSPEPRKMNLWGSVSLGRNSPEQLPVPERFYGTDTEDNAVATQAISQPTYHFVQGVDSWKRYHHSTFTNAPDDDIDRLIVASYNVLAGLECSLSSGRQHSILTNMLSARAAADIIVLQDVTDKFLSVLLADQEVCSRYPYSTHGPPDHTEAGPLPSHLNVVVMSRFPLQWSYLSFHHKHKGAVIATLPSVKNRASSEAGSSPLVLAACHLSQGLTEEAVVTKKTEVQKLLTHLFSNFEGHPWIIAGGFNLSTSSHSLDAARHRQDLSALSHRYLRQFDSMLSDMGLQDAWLTSRIFSGESSGQNFDQRLVSELYEGEQGATFDPFTNELASKTAGGEIHNRRPQRYDRILVNDYSHFRPCRFNMFGFPSTETRGDSSRVVASDHWGIRCLFERPRSRVLDPSGAIQGSATQICRAKTVLGGLEEIKRCLGLRRVPPNAEDLQKRVQAVKTLQHALQCQGYDELDGGPRKGPRLVLVPVGSFALGVWTASSDVDCLCIGEISERTFFLLAKSRLKKRSSEEISILRKSKTNSGTMLELEVRGIKFDLQYCSGTSFMEQFPDVMKRPSSDPVFALPPSTQSKLKPLRDLSYIQRSIPDMAQYRVAHILLKEWAKSRGLYGTKFGLLGSIHLSVMLVPICKTLARDNGSVTVEDILVSFFNRYANFEWERHTVFDPFFHGSVKYHRSFREPLCLLGWHTPGLNTASNASAPAVKTLEIELRRAHSILSQETTSWDQLLGAVPGDVKSKGSLSQGLADFLRSHRTFVRINLRYWGSSSSMGAKFVGWLESRCVTLIVDLNKKVPALMPRIWPQRFSEEPAEVVDMNRRPECHGFYLIGLSWQETSPEQRSEDKAKITESALRAALGQFETRMRGEERYFDANFCWLSAEAVRRNELGSLHVDHHHLCDVYGEHGILEDELDSEGEDEDEFEGGGGEAQSDDEQGIHWASTQSIASTQRGRGSAITKVPGKFRTATDVMNRLRWDPSLDGSDYIIGYEDRFTGTREKGLELWKTEQTDEEFIPQHRILYFKRRSDGTIMWERRARIDNIFGSGISKDDMNER